MKLKETLPDIYILSDPDLELNPNMPYNFSDIFLEISEKHKAYKVGSALDLSDSDKFIQCDNYTNGKNIYDWESQFWENPISDTNYELYDAGIDTTFTLINNKYQNKQIRIAGDFTAKHLPWYNGFLKKHIPKDEFEAWKEGNNSSSILNSCITD
jgi:hypothetical protein